MSNFRPRLFLFSLFYIDNNNNNISTRGSNFHPCLLPFCTTSNITSFIIYCRYIIYTTTISIILKLRWDCLILTKFSNISPEEYFPRNAASYLQWFVRKHFPRIFPITLTGTYRRYFWMLSQNSFRIFNVVPKFLPNFDVVPEFLQNFECWILNVVPKLQRIPSEQSCKDWNMSLSFMLWN